MQKIQTCIRCCVFQPALARCRDFYGNCWFGCLGDADRLQVSEREVLAAVALVQLEVGHQGHIRMIGMYCPPPQSQVLFENELKTKLYHFKFVRELKTKYDPYLKMK